MLARAGARVVACARSADALDSLVAEMHGEGHEAVALDLEDVDAVREAVANGLGIGIALEDETLPHEQLKALRIADAEIVLHPHVSCLQERKDAPLIRAFFDLAAEQTPDG